MGFVAETLGVACLHVFVCISIHGCEIEFHRLVLSVFQRAFLVLLRLRTL